METRLLSPKLGGIVKDSDAQRDNILRRVMQRVRNHFFVYRGFSFENIPNIDSLCRISFMWSVPIHLRETSEASLLTPWVRKNPAVGQEATPNLPCVSTKITYICVFHTGNTCNG